MSRPPSSLHGLAKREQLPRSPRRSWMIWWRSERWWWAPGPCHRTERGIPRRAYPATGPAGGRLYLSAYRTTVVLLRRLAGARFASLDTEQRNELVTRYRLGSPRLSGRTRTSDRFPTMRATVRTQVVRRPHRRLLRRLPRVGRSSDTTPSPGGAATWPATRAPAASGRRDRRPRDGRRSRHRRRGRRRRHPGARAGPARHPRRRARVRSAPRFRPPPGVRAPLP